MKLPSIGIRGGDGGHAHRPAGAALVIEDEAMVREVLAASLILLGFSVDSAERIESAMALLDARHYDVIVIDRVMPGLGGGLGVDRIRTVLSGRPCMIIGVSGNASPEIVEEWKRSGIDAFVEKPLNIATLRSLIDQWRGARRTEVPSAPAPMRPPVIQDPTVRQEIESLGQRTGRDLYLPMWRELVASVPEHLARIDAALESDDPRRIADAAHGLRGFARSVGAVDLATACAAIEDEVSSSDPTRRRALRTALDAAVERLGTVKVE